MSNSDFKGVRGGNPAMRPVMVEAKVPCRHCGRMMVTVTEPGQPSKHACAFCVSKKDSREKCVICYSRKGKTFLRRTPRTSWLSPGRHYFHKHCLNYEIIKLRVLAEEAEDARWNSGR